MKKEFETEFSRAVKEWQASASYALDANDGILYCSKYREDLKTRLLHAFTAGWDSRVGDATGEEERIKQKAVELFEKMSRLNWLPVDSPDELPDDDLIYWVTYKDFYGIKLGKGKRDGQMWEVERGTKISLNRIIAVMPERIPKPYRPLPKPFKGDEK